LSKVHATMPDLSPMLTKSSLVEKIALIWICFAAAIYIAELIFFFNNGGLSTSAGRVLGEDFINYYAGAWLAWHGQAAHAYLSPAYHAFLESVAGPTVFTYVFIYPPLAMLLAGPFATMPYLPALFVWLGASWYSFYRALRLAMPGRNVLLLALATPAVLVSARGGQNGAWSAALIGGGLCLLERRPTVAGILFGLQIYKPQLGLLIPVALLAGWHCRAFFAAVVTAVLLVAATVGIFGLAVWGEFFHVALGLPQTALVETSSLYRVVSVFMMARSIGASVAAAYVAQAASALIAATVVAVAFFRKSPAPIKNTLLVLGTFLATPYVLDYDLVVGAFVAAWLTDRAVMPPMLMRLAIAASGLVLLAPLLAYNLGAFTGLQLGPVCFIPGFVLAARLVAGGCVAAGVGIRSIACNSET
jgi:arabinofuranan 3-O-arabinosyltransferase